MAPGARGLSFEARPRGRAPQDDGGVDVAISNAICGSSIVARISLRSCGLNVLLASVCLLAAGTSVCSAGDIKAGREKALMCQACHGLDGLSKTPDAPNIAAQTEAYIVAQLQAYKSGARKNDAMSVVAPSLSDNDIEDLAAYFSAIEINVVKIPGQ
jgi:cytochrome c553